MNQVIYFAEVPEEYKNCGEYYEHDGHYFYFQAEITEDGITFTDTCNRVLPIDYTSLLSLEKIVVYARNLFEQTEALAKNYTDEYEIKHKELVRNLAHKYGFNPENG